MSTEIEKYLYYPEIVPRKTYSVDLFKILALVLIAIGIIGVYFASSAFPAPIYRIRDIIGNFYLNYATVMIEGRIVQPVRLDLQSGGRIRLTINIVDEEGSEPFTVFVYDPVASELLMSNNYVDFGDIVRLIIQVRVREDFTYGILQDVSHVIVLKRSWESGVELDNVYSLLDIEEYTYICSSGLVTNPRNVSAGLLFEITTSGGSVSVIVPRSFTYRFSNREDYRMKWSVINKAGSFVKICGPVYYYRVDQPEIVVVRYEDIFLETIPEAPEVRVSELSKYIDQYVSVTGLLDKLTFDRNTEKYIISIMSREGLVAYGIAVREIVSTGINPWRVGTGSEIKLIGKVMNSSTITVSSIKTVNIQSPFNTTIVGESLQQGRGTIVILWSVRVVSFTNTTGGNWIIQVTDDVDRITVFIPSSVARGISTSPPPIGSIVAVAGYRDVYDTTQQIIVYTEDGLKTLATPRYEPVSLSEIGNYLYSYVSVKGEIVGIRYSSPTRLYYVSIMENNSVVNATMTRDLVVRINPWKAGPGTFILVNGSVLSSTRIEAHYVEVTSPRDTPSYSIADALKQPLGTIVVVYAEVTRAEVTRAEVTSGGSWRIFIRDGTGEILVFIPSSVAREIGGSPPSAGSRIGVAGYRDVYGNTQEIVVYCKEGLRTG